MDPQAVNQTKAKRANPPRPWAAWAKHAIALLAVAFVLQMVHGYGMNWFNWKAETGFNPAFQEGLAWRLGRTDLRYYLPDTAHNPADGRYYNVYPPLLSFIAYVSAWTIPASTPMPDAASMPVFHWVPLLLIGLPIPFVAYYVFHDRTGSAFWAATLTVSLIGGTAVLPCIAIGRLGYLFHMNHLMAVTGLLLLVNETLHRRRLSILILGVILSAWTRQLTLVFGVVALIVLVQDWMAATQSPDRSSNSSPKPLPAPSGARRRLTRAAVFGLTIVIILTVQLGLNWMKFKNPFDTGYAYLYEGRDTPNAINATAHGLFSLHFVPTNAYYMNLAMPWQPDPNGHWHWEASAFGASLWLSTPLALLCLAGVGQWWHDRAARLLVLASGAIIAVHLLYHNTGWMQSGYYRFALDYLPVWFVVAAPWLATGWRRWATGACTAWSIAYFAMVHFLNQPGTL